MKPHYPKFWGIIVNVKSISFWESRWRVKSATLIAALFLAAVVACSKKTEAPPAAPPKVTVAHPEQRTLVDEDLYNGWLEAAENVEVRARVRGHIAKIGFTDGQIVKKGDLLFQLDPRPFEAEVGRSRDELRVVEAQKVAADRDYERMKQLVGEGAVSKTEADKSEARALSLAAQVEAAKQEIARKALDVEYARITAPIGGRVGRAQLTVGNLVNAGGTDPVLTTIVSIDPIFLYFNIDERSLQRYQKTNAERTRQKTGAHAPSFPSTSVWTATRASRTRACWTSPITASIHAPEPSRCAAWWQIPRADSFPGRACACASPSATLIRRRWFPTRRFSPTRIKNIYSC